MEGFRKMLCLCEVDELKKMLKELKAKAKQELLGGGKRKTSFSSDSFSASYDFSGVNTSTALSLIMRELSRRGCINLPPRNTRLMVDLSLPEFCPVKECKEIDLSCEEDEKKEKKCCDK